MENSLNHSLAKQMEIITIDSSDSDGDVEFEPDAPFGVSLIGATAQQKNVSKRLTDQSHDWLVDIPPHHRNGLDDRLGRNGKDETSVLSPEGSMQASQTKYHPEFMPQKCLSDSVINGEFGTFIGSVEGAMYDPQLQKEAALMPQANPELGSINVGNTADASSSQNSMRILPSSLLSHKSPSLLSHKSRHISVPSIASLGKVLSSPHESSMQAERHKISQAGQGIVADDNSRRDANVASSNLHMEGAHSVKERKHIYEKETRALPFHWIDQTANSSQTNASTHSRVTDHMEDAYTMKEKNPIYEKDTRTLPFHWIDRAPNRSQMNEPMHSMATGQDSYFISKPSHPMLASKANNVHEFSHMSIRNEKSNSSSKVHEVRDDVSSYENVPATRTLPQYPSKSNGYLRPASYNDGVHFPGLVEQRPGHDETPIYQEALQNLGQPKLEDDLPEGHLTVSLLKHQKIALAWMVQKEKSVHCAGGILADDQGLGKTISMIALILKQIGLQSKFMTDDSHNFRTEAFSLDDDGGNDEVEAKHSGEDIHKKPVASTSENRRPAAGTLVICPASVLRQWQRELQEKVSSSSQISVLFYHGARTKDPRDLAKYDVVLTTYSIVANEVPKHCVAEDDDDEQRNMEKHGLSPEFAISKKRKQTFNTGRNGKKKAKGLKGSQLDYGSGPLARVRWFRVILDEAQTIKNHRTQVARACSALRAKRRWCLSGTPMQNAIDDLYSYFRFLKYDPYAIYSSFCNSIKHPISRNASEGYKKLQAVLRIVMLRRTKGTLINGEPIIKLPPKSICLENVEFSPEERAFYLKLEADYRQQFKVYAAAGTVKQNYANILLMLLRLRQACDHPVLVKGYYSEAIARDSLEMARQLPKEMLSNLLYQLEAKLAICPVCSDTTEDPVVTMCGHVFCYQCVSDRITGDDNTCPAIGCKDILGTDSVFSQATLKSCISDERDNKDAASSSNSEESSIVQNTYVSSKIRAAVNILNSMCSQCSQPCGMDDSEDDWRSVKPEKAIVFSQWTGMLDLVEISLNYSLIQYRRLDGTMSLSSRDRSVREFTTDPEVTVMLMSLKAGNLGLNMVAACHVILLDLWWNPTTEDQAIDRAHRIGQTRPVTVTRLTIKDTVEDRILALQEEKRKMVSSAFGEDHAGNHAARLTVEDLKYLFRV